MSARRSPSTERQPAPHQPIARVCVDTPLPHLDTPFDYLVPAPLADVVVPGSRVRVRFSGKLLDAFVLERRDHTDHTGPLSYVDRSISAEPVLSPEVARLARAVADRWAGSLSDVLRLAIPSRHARVEAESAQPAASAPAAPEAAGWSTYGAGVALLRAIGRGQAARAVWSAVPGESWPTRLAEAAAAAAAAGWGALLVVPDRRDLCRLDAALADVLGPGRHVALAAGLGPAERYRRWLAVRRGAVRVVAGTRGAGLAPVADLGLVAIWDDGDDLHAEPRAPYPHARDLLVLRAHLAGAACIVGGFARTAEAAQLVQTGWAQDLRADRGSVRDAAPRVVASGADAELGRDDAARSARLPSVALRAARACLLAGAPVLVQVPRRGYLPALACARCRTPARCATCSGTLAASSGHAIPACRWCGRPAGRWRCPVCEYDRLRSIVVGAARTADELGRAFPGTTVRTSAGATVLDAVAARPDLVVATPGAEPPADGGYGAALLLDGWALLRRPDLRAAEETLRRWSNAAALVRPATDGGTVVVVADAQLAVVQALVRWDPAGHAERELAERAELRFPPTTRMASVTGPATDVADLIAVVHLPEQIERLGPVPVDASTERLLLRVPRADGAALAAALHAGAAVRSARKAPPVRIQLDPLEIG